MTREIPLLLQILELLHYDIFLPAHSKPTLELWTFVPCIGKVPSCSLPQRQQMLPSTFKINSTNIHNTVHNNNNEQAVGKCLVGIYLRSPLFFLFDLK